MMKAFLIGILIAAIDSAVAWGLHDLHILTRISGGLGLFLIFMGAVLSGNTGSLMRSPTHVRQDTEDGRKRRLRIATYLVLIGLPNAVAAMATFYVH